MGSRLILSSGFTKRRVSRRARSHTAFQGGGVATGRGRTTSWWAHISSAADDVKSRRLTSPLDALQLLEQHLTHGFQLAQIGELLLVLAGDVGMPRTASPSCATGVAKAGSHGIEVVVGMDEIAPLLDVVGQRKRHVRSAPAVAPAVE